MSDENAPCAAGVTADRCGTWRGYRGGCRCLGCRYAIRVYNQRQRARTPAQTKAATRRRDFMRRYGITSEQVDEMKRSQGGACAVCRQRLGTGKHVHVDHCHRTQRIRGILCATCNSGIGKLGDTAKGLRRALAYLERFEEASKKR